MTEKKPVRRRARKADGQFKGDNPTTPDSMKLGNPQVLMQPCLRKMASTA